MKRESSTQPEKLVLGFVSKQDEEVPRQTSVGMTEEELLGIELGFPTVEDLV